MIDDSVIGTGRQTLSDALNAQDEATRLANQLQQQKASIQLQQNLQNSQNQGSVLGAGLGFGAMAAPKIYGALQGLNASSYAPGMAGNSAIEASLPTSVGGTTGTAPVAGQAAINASIPADLGEAPGLAPAAGSAAINDSIPSTVEGLSGAAGGAAADAGALGALGGMASAALPSLAFGAGGYALGSAIGGKTGGEIGAGIGALAPLLLLL